MIEAVIGSEAATRLIEREPGLYVYGSSGAEPWKDVADARMQEILSAISAGEPWRDAVGSRIKENAWVRRMVTSPSRGMFLDMLGIASSQRVLDLGCGWGQLTWELARRADQVFSVEPTWERLEFCYRVSRQEKLNNVCCICADAFDLPFAPQSFDLVLMCGVFEWLATGAQIGDVQDCQKRVLKAAATLLRPGGKVVIAIENRRGLKYLLGEVDDHSKEVLISCLPFAEAQNRFRNQQGQELRARTYSQPEYSELLSDCGFVASESYLAFPDYKLPQLVVPFSAPEVMEDLVQRIDMPDEHNGCNGKRSRYNEVLHRTYRAIGEGEILRQVAPSYLIVGERL